MMKVDYAEVLGLNRVTAKQNYVKTLPVKQNVFAATTFGRDKIDIGPLDASLVTYDAATNITAPKVPTVPTVTTLGMASKIASINTDRTGMSSAEVQARLKAISEAAEKDDFTGLTDGEIFGVIYNRYFVNFGNVNFGGVPGAVNNKDLEVIREQYLGDLENVLGDVFGDGRSMFIECYSEMLGCAGMTPVEKQQHISIFNSNPESRAFPVGLRVKPVMTGLGLDDNNNHTQEIA